MRSAALHAQLRRPLLTFVLVVIAMVTGKWLWVYYQIDSWTRDVRVRVDVADVAPTFPAW
jgi:multidrug resistance efflux pump